MKLLYEDSGGQVFYAVYQYDWERGFTHSTNIALSEFEIQDEIQNAALCKDLVRTQFKRNSAGQFKYFVTGGDTLNSVDGWVEEVII